QQVLVNVDRLFHGALGAQHVAERKVCLEGFRRHRQRSGKGVDCLVRFVVEEEVESAVILPVGLRMTFAERQSATGVATKQPAAANGTENQQKLKDGRHQITEQPAWLKRELCSFPGAPVAA